MMPGERNSMRKYDVPDPPEEKMCPICDGYVEETQTGWKCAECDWSIDDEEYDRDRDEPE
jgi:hypothetical protein